MLDDGHAAAVVGRERELRPDSRQARFSQLLGHSVSFQASRGGKEAAADSLRLLHEDDPERGRREDVEAGEGDEVAAVAGRDRVVVGCDLGQDDRELAVGDEGGAHVQALARAEPADDAGAVPARELGQDGEHDGESDEPADAVERAHVDREPEHEEEERREDVAEGEEALLDLLPDGRFREDDARHQRADRLREAELLGDRGHADEEAERDQEHELARQAAEQSIDGTTCESRRRDRDRDEDEGLGDGDEGRAHSLPARGREAEDAGDDDVLEDEDGEDEVGLVVGEAAEVDQPLDRHRARRDVDRGREDQRREAEPERDHADEEADRRVHGQVDGAAEADVPSAAQQAVDRELEAEEEEQEDDPELRDERRHLGWLDQARHVRLVRSEQQSREQVGGDGREAEAPRDQAERRQQGDRQGELRERHASVILRGPWLSRCEPCASAAAPASPPRAPPSSAATSARSAPECGAALEHVCPNCGGELVPRPRRADAS